jgi:hypothetical protein
MAQIYQKWQNRRIFLILYGFFCQISTISLGNPVVEVNELPATLLHSFCSFICKIGRFCVEFLHS